MHTYHHKKLLASQKDLTLLKEAIPQHEYQEGYPTGFIMDAGKGQTVFRGRYIYTKHKGVPTLDSASLVSGSIDVTYLAAVRFELNGPLGLVSVERNRASLNALYTELSNFPDVLLEFEDLCLNMHDLVEEIAEHYKHSYVTSVKLKDYLAKDNMIGNVTFKLLDPQDSWRILEKYADQVDAIGLNLKLPEGKCLLKISRKGSLSFSDEAPAEFIKHIQTLLPKYHEASVETVRVLDPAAVGAR